ncbi:sensor histidine kinase [Brevibacterium jeotgali]|uniref:histidine kinase n=1 Tax=Brevibacterium jeotgali TaxID=1262550 RepID=A0A2H1L1J2_9MICO|nr:sensor histidine kinase [Brevibacterium jeotgali]TWC01881.1 signal transduction histidine kinase [Brevibacterium jeotgali]SMY10768.1 Signal transduction histidine kinase [Brevibacterium jeotgali]
MNDEPTTRPLRPDDDRPRTPEPGATASAETRAYEPQTRPYDPQGEELTTQVSTPVPAPTAVMDAPEHTGAVPTGHDLSTAPAVPRTHGRDAADSVRLFEPQRLPWAMGMLNVLVSAVLTVVWLWFPIVLFVTGLGGIFALGAGIFALAAWFFLQRGVNHLERVRSEAVYGEQNLVPAARRTRRTGFPGWLHQQWLILTSQGFWRSTAHHVVKTLYGGTIGILLLAGLTFSTFALTSAINPVIFDGLISADASMAARMGLGLAGGASAVVGFVILGLSVLPDRLLDRSLLPPTRAAALRAERDTLTREVGALETARTGAVDAATTERLRIERDLHDGVQPMLVALSMKLGMARRKLDTDPEGGRDLVAEAHQDSKDAITELRQLARGIHPAVLEDRGLDAAISALAARSSVPVAVDVQVPADLNKEAESVSYFVVAESLTNIAKHAQAHSVRVAVRGAQPGRLQIVVADDGAGGARIDRGGTSTGLAGLADRVASAKGTLTVTSPIGGPTTIVAEVPCAS